MRKYFKSSDVLKPKTFVDTQLYLDKMIENEEKKLNHKIETLQHYKNLKIKASALTLRF